MFTGLPLSGTQWRQSDVKSRVVDPGQKISDFSKQIFKTSRFFQTISPKRDFSDKFLKNFDYLVNFTKISIFQAKNGHL